MASLPCCLVSVPTKHDPRSILFVKLPPTVPRIPNYLALTKRSIRSSSSNKNHIRPPSTAQHFHLRVWNDHDFITSCTTDWESEIKKGRLKELEDEVKNILGLTSSDRLKQLDLVDKIQRLGVAYHFKDEIQEILEQSYNDDFSGYNNQSTYSSAHQTGLLYISLRFRLLRSAGYYVSSAVFNAFTNEKGDFLEELASDMEGILSLYEASYASFKGEDIMDDAMAFTTKHLHSMVSLSSPLSLQAKRALDTPLQRSTEREQSRHYISIYEQDKSRNKTLLEFAKLDYNHVQLLHKKEITEIIRWWDRIDIKSKIPFDVRDRSVEAYAAVNAFNFEPTFSKGRIHLTKLWCIFTILDDAYDVYGDLNELRQLTAALERWDIEDDNELSDHMKVVFTEVLQFFKGIEEEFIRRGNTIGLPYLKKEIQVYSRGLYEEIKLLVSGNIPTLEKWLSISEVTIGFNPFALLIAMNMEKHETTEVYDWITTMPKICKCTYLIQRLWDDCSTFKIEQKRGIMVTGVTCYMKDHGVSESEAIMFLQKMIADLWKDLNQENLRVNNPLSIDIIKTFINTTRMFGLYYKHGDGFTNSNGSTKEVITSLFIDGICI